VRKAIVLREHLTDPVLKEGWQQWMAAHGLDSSADGTLGPLVVEAQVHHGGTVAPFPTGIWRAGG
jgi:hypothetical protein